MTNTIEIDFYFDFASPYAYFLAEPLEKLAEKHALKLNWHPVMLWALLKSQNLPAPLDTPGKGAYMLHDMKRSAEFYGLPFQLPDPFPVSSHLPARLFYAIAQKTPSLASQYAKTALRDFFTHGRAINDKEVIANIGKQVGLDPDDALQHMGSDAAKSALQSAIEEATQREVWGSPFVFVGDEGFFGVDRLPQIQRLIENLK